MDMLTQSFSPLGFVCVYMQAKCTFRLGKNIDQLETGGKGSRWGWWSLRGFFFFFSPPAEDCRLSLWIRHWAVLVWQYKSAKFTVYKSLLFFWGGGGLRSGHQFENLHPILVFKVVECFKSGALLEQAVVCVLPVSAVITGAAFLCTAGPAIWVIPEKGWMLQ